MTPKTAKTENGRTSPTAPDQAPAIEMLNTYSLRPCPENEKIYRRITPDDPAVRELVEKIRIYGVDPIRVSLDNFIISGHQRHAAAKILRLKKVPCLRVNIYRGGDEDDDPSPEWLKLLAAHNTQRIKTRTEMMNESLIQISADDAYSELERYRWEQGKVKAETIKIGKRGRRKRISAEKQEMAQALLKIVNDNEHFWPLSDRAIHYRMLNRPPLRNTKNPQSRYRNDTASYKDTCDMLTRLRLSYKIPMHAIADPTRPTTIYNTYSNTRAFIEDELKNFFKGYRRDLQLTQPLHIEVVAEKMTVESIIKPVCRKYNIPLTIGRGYSSLPPRADIASRFKQSGKQTLLLLILGDLDPEGVSIGETLLQSLREDLYIYNAEAVRIGLNQEHVQRFGLFDNSGEAKKSSARYKKFVKKYGTKVYELEALSPEQLQEILEESIQRVIDRTAFEAEIDEEKKDWHFLTGIRSQVSDVLKEMLAEGGGECS